MKRTAVFAIVALIMVLCCAGAANAEAIWVRTNAVGYTGSVSYTDINTGQATVTDTATPRNMYVTWLSGYSSEYTTVMTDWSHHSPSNQHDSFFQLQDQTLGTVDSFNGQWSADGTSFTITVIGSDADYANSMARGWMPDQGVSSRVTWLDYAWTLTFTGLTKTASGNWFYSPTGPASITGTFSGTYVSENYTSSQGWTAYENTYHVNLTLDSALFSEEGQDGTVYTNLQTSTPEPASLLLLGGGMASLAAWRRRRRS